MKGRLHDRWSAELLKRALSQTDDIELALEAVAEALHLDPNPRRDDEEFWHQLPDGFGQAFAVLDAEIAALQPTVDAGLAIVGTQPDRRP